jgi:hypothetical protein
MKKLKSILIGALFMISGMVLAFVLNFFVLENILIPDPYYYHSHHTTKLFDVFYTLTVDEGGHPFPTKFNFIITLVIGFLSGFGCLKNINLLPSN